MSAFGTYWRPAPFIRGYLILFAQELCKVNEKSDTSWLQYILTRDDVHGIPPGKCIEINIRFVNEGDTVVVPKDGG